MAALAPSISHALAASGQGGFAAATIEICTVDGIKQLDAQGRDSIPGGMHFEHCLFCLTHGASFGLPPPVATALPAPVAATFAPRLFFHAPRPLFAWAAAQPRAPPPGS